MSRTASKFVWNRLKSQEIYRLSCVLLAIQKSRSDAAGAGVNVVGFAIDYDLGAFEVWFLFF